MTVITARPTSRARLRIAGELLDQRLVGGAGHALPWRPGRPAAIETISAGDLRDQAVADCEQRIGAPPPSVNGSPLLRDADDHAADDV